VGLRDNPPGLIQTGDIERRLRSAYGIRGKSVTPRLGDQLHPVTVVDDLAHPDWYDPTDIKRAWFFVTVAPVAGQLGLLTIANPLGSGTLIFLESCHFIGAANATRIGRVTGIEPPTIGAGNLFDDRAGALFTTTARIRSGTSVATQIAVVLAQIFPRNTVGLGDWFPIGAVLQPGGLAWGIEHGTANQQLDAAFKWQERPLTP